MKQETIHIGGIPLSVEVSGAGPRAVIVMHGWGCKAATVRVLADAAAGAGATVYNLDLPGFGDTPEPPEAWGVEEYAGFVEEFCRMKGIERPVLMGHSFGGRIAIVMASRTPVEKVVLVDAAGIKPRRSLRYYVKVYSFKAAKWLLPKIVGKSHGHAVIERMRGRAGSSDYSQSSPRMRAVMSRVVNQDLRHLLPAISAPTLLIWGERDTATPIADARLMERLIPDAGLVSYPEAGHYSFLDRPAQTRAVIENFVSPSK